MSMKEYETKLRMDLSLHKLYDFEAKHYKYTQGQTVGQYCPVLYKVEFDSIRSSIPHPNGRNYFEELPNEVLEKIIGYLLVRNIKMSITDFASTCKRFNKLSLQFLFKKIHLANEETYSFRNLLITRADVGACVKSIGVSLRVLSRAELKDFCCRYAEIMIRCKQCKSVSFSTPSAPYSDHQHARKFTFPRLITNETAGGYKSVLKCVLTAGDERVMRFQIFAEAFTRLEKLELIMVKLGKLVRTSRDTSVRMPRLSTLKLFNVKLNKEAIKLMASAMPNLQVIVAQNMHYGVAELLADFGSRCKTLTCVSMGYCNMEGMNSLRIAQDVWPKLSALEIDSCMLHSSGILPTVPLPRMKRLKIRGVLSDFYPPEEITRALSKLPDLICAGATAVDWDVVGRVKREMKFFSKENVDPGPITKQVQEVHDSAPWMSVTLRKGFKREEVTVIETKYDEDGRPLYQYMPSPEFQ
ncbi:hypothetical protein V1514DRAFT_317763 [Lipomyces japonicus]|uniref:uncharacterized protein n=1 Tax=Lipomyces japonicus TaxID=56871 RepID=UPI0034CE6659